MLSLVAVAGLSLGAIRVRGIGLGSAGVLFAGILWGHFGQDVDTTILHFVKEFGLVLFVYTTACNWAQVSSIRSGPKDGS